MTDHNLLILTHCIVLLPRWAGDELKALGAAIEYVDLGTQTLPDGSVLPLPPVLMGELGT